MSVKKKIDTLGRILLIRKAMRKAGLSEFEIVQEQNSGPYVFQAGSRYPSELRKAVDILARFCVLSPEKPSMKFVSGANGTTDYYYLTCWVRCRTPFAGDHNLSSNPLEKMNDQEWAAAIFGEGVETTKGVVP